ncbi:MAG: carbohydrate-binding family 9-like protein [Balneolaceae bacterium]
MTVQRSDSVHPLAGTVALLAIPVFLLSCNAPDPSVESASGQTQTDSLTVDWPYPCQEANIPEYTVYRTDSSIHVDGKLDEAAWGDAPLSPRFIDLISGEDPIHDTHVKLLWDEEALYVGFLIEEPVINGTLTERNDPLYNENNAEVFIAGQDAYYEFEINALGTLYEAFFIWEEAYDRGGFADNPAFARDNPLLRDFNGVGWREHPRGPRVGSWDFWFPDLETAVHIDGEINNDEIRDRGWYVEIAFPWHGMEWLAKADDRPLPPLDGDIWRIDFSRFNPYKAAPPANDSGGWSLSSHGIWDSHIPECFPYIHFRDEPVANALP